jgi:hypothetical protein
VRRLRLSHGHFTINLRGRVRVKFVPRAGTGIVGTTRTIKV